MARSTKIQKIVTDALSSRITATESGVTAIQTRNLVDEGDNVSVLVNDAGYQNAAQVDTKIQAVVGAAPAALDTLKEIADALADDDSAIAALVAQDTANAAAITNIEAVNTTQDAAIAQHAADIAALEALVAIPTLSAISTSVEIFIDNSTGSDASTAPTVSATPVKTFARALEYVRNNYYFTDSVNNSITLTLLADYAFGFDESAIFDGSLITGSTSLIIKSNNTTARTITASARQPIVFKNFSYELKLQTITFSTNSFVQITQIPRVLVTTVSFQKLTVRICELFQDLTTGSTFNGVSKFTNVDTVRFLSASAIKNLISVTKADLVVMGGQISQGLFDLWQVTGCQLLNGSSISELDLSTAGTAIFTFRDVNDVNLNTTLNLNSTSGVILRRLFNCTNVNAVRATTALTLVNNHNTSISHQGTAAIIKLIHSEATTFNISSGSGFQPVFVAQDATKKFIDLEYSGYSIGIASTSEDSIKTSIYATTDRPVVLDKFSQFFEENLLDLRGRITRRTLTTDITLSASDTVRQHLINQTTGDRNIGLPLTPTLDQEFEVINNSTSTFNLIFAGETVIPGTRHAVQWDGTEWVVM
ncbi:MAG: hypothetical protein RLZZ171_2988 [Cyanobacteriota bacterium]|jgi:hypothetical protein